ncbi:hypothetical protein FF80_00856 [Devosia sp. LC5]|uniref:hypothetical protein n=1 Tax=Devosia sp. LC5 TaxID=1502724 RepID=UPI0004E2E367|nr:hypothetical protein [Devosia sp. LC5]KFC70585.1 hypothetical protein FF80_00856 [Devosia sp. LC5]
MRITKSVSLMLLAGVASIGVVQPSMALEAQAFLDRVALVYKTIGYEFAFGEGRVEGDTVIVDGVKVGLAGIDTFDFPTEITFSGVTERSDGGYMVREVSIPDIDTEFAKKPSGHVTLADVKMEGLYLPGGEAIPAGALLQLVQSISTGPLSLTRDGKEVLSYDSVVAGSTFTPAQGEAITDLTSKLTVSGITVDLTSVKEEDPAAGAIIDELGLDTVSGNVTQNLSWSMADGRMVMDQFLFDFADVGALDINLDVTGMTPEMLDKIYAMQAAMATGDATSEEAQSAQMMSGMQLMQAISIVSAKVRYDDASLAGKLLDFFASQSGGDRATFVAGLKSMLPTLIDQSGIPTLKDVVVPPVSAFLDDPQSLEVTVQPENPTTLLVLTAAAANPAGLITALGLAITANE